MREWLKTPLEEEVLGGRGHTWSLGQSAGSPEVGQELEAQTHDEVPDVPGHLRASDEDAPDEDQQHRVESVSDVSQPVNGRKRGSIIQ